MIYYLNKRYVVRPDRGGGRRFYSSRYGLALMMLIVTAPLTAGASARNSNAAKINPIIVFVLFGETEGSKEMTPEEAPRALIQSTLGSRYDDSARNSSFKSWLDTQFDLPQTRTVEVAESKNWVTNYPRMISGAENSSLTNVMLVASNQLGQRTA